LEPLCHAHLVALSWNYERSLDKCYRILCLQAYRLLAAEQYNLGWDYPLHLGVTEAGEGEDGRMKSSIGDILLIVACNSLSILAF
jgi:4-hydroxy-3-methylbut-2-en-1-yl diphosphate synthase IspG/GcpE